jgi:hypothetical protein
MKRLSLILTLFTAILLTSCMDAAQNGRVGNKTDNSSGGGTNAPGDGDNITNTDGSIGGDSENPIAKIEIRHLIEPKIDEASDGGDYKRKLTIPKNYNGLLYLAGINISSLGSESVSVRFSFGYDSSSITLPATVSTAPGLTPQTDVEVLILDMRSKPFEDIQLLYDLYDYNTYDFAASGSDPGALVEPVNFNRNDKLFCRGLALKDDSTFSGNLVDGCSDSNDICKYAYAKVVDKGLVESGSPDLPIVPSEMNVQRTSSGYYNDTDSTKLDRCLPDNPLLTGSSYVFDFSTSFGTFESTNIIDSKTYIFRGPYRPINFDNWEIGSEALKGQFGIFGGIYDDNTNGLVDDAEVEYGYSSRLFPLYSKFNLLKDWQYMGSVTPDDEKILTNPASNSESFWMDGCNERATTVHDVTGEHIGSCNVTATIEIIRKTDDGKTIVVDVTDEVKLQLVKETKLNTVGDNVLLSSFQQCSSSGQCGSDSCCINKRCWSKSLVSQCVEDLPSFGDLETGDVCNSDYQCSSLCCNKVDGRCAPHDTVSSTPSFCSKPSGQSCVAKEWCQKHPVTTCGIVSTGTDPNGGVTCALRCVTVEVFGECVAGDGMGAAQCVPPCQPTPPVFNPEDPNRCDSAFSFESLVEIANNPTCG